MECCPDTAGRLCLQLPGLACEKAQSRSRTLITSISRLLPRSRVVSCMLFCAKTLRDSIYGCGDCHCRSSKTEFRNDRPTYPYQTKRHERREAHVVSTKSVQRADQHRLTRARHNPAVGIVVEEAAEGRSYVDDAVTHSTVGT